MDPFLFTHIPLEVKKQELVSLQEHNLSLSAGHFSPNVARYSDYLPCNDSSLLGPCSAWHLL